MSVSYTTLPCIWPQFASILKAAFNIAEIPFHIAGCLS
jgi:hypothetical protein